jgi:uncharacterized hydrophobic protein (TIGR00271 family)
MPKTLDFIRRFLKDRFSLHDDKADERQIIESISRNVEFKGTNLWTLIFAILIASIGLNVNSAAAIIGGMLISPIMGPIMGIGLGIGINDVDLIKKSIKNWTIAAVISIAASTFYFFISPLQEAQSELLARTTPTIWDVFIAFFGGLAGIIAGTRKEKSTVIPGVAIATALMPPLCTVGFGLAKGNLLFVLGAFYLFFINSVFICISSYLIVSYLHLPKKQFDTPERKRKVYRYIWAVVIVTALPSIYLTYGMVEKSIFENNASLFVRREFKFRNTYVVNKAFKYEDGKKEIDLLLVGDDLSKMQIDSLQRKLSRYGIGNAKLIIHQGVNADQNFDFAKIKANILQDIVDRNGSEEAALYSFNRVDTFPDLRNELKVLYPEIKEYSLSRTVVKTIDSAYADTVVLFYCRFNSRRSMKTVSKMQEWLQSRLRTSNLKVIID